jgi:hypothetical protein
VSTSSTAATEVVTVVASGTSTGVVVGAAIGVVTEVATGVSLLEFCAEAPTAKSMARTVK